MRGRLSLLAALCLVGLVGCDLVRPAAPEPPAPPAKANPFDAIYRTHRSEVAKAQWEAGHKDFKTDQEEMAWLVERWAKLEKESWSPIRSAEQRYLGNGQWTPERAKAFRRKLAKLADPNVEKAEPLDDLSFDDDDGL